MIYLAFSGAKSVDWLDNEYIGFWLGVFVLEGRNHLLPLDLSLFLDPKVES
jgi:hypothetical protein